MRSIFPFPRWRIGDCMYSPSPRERNGLTRSTAAAPLPRRLFHASHAFCHKYQPLRDGEIRLIDLYPGREGEPLRCQLRNVSFLSRPQYESLSYCWGLNRPEAEIQAGHDAIPVTKNLSTALQHLRSRDARALWIDAICINQSDVVERSQQVALMKDIFECSERTVVWLGEESEDSPRAVQLIRQLAHASKERGSHRFWTSHESTRLPPLYDPAWRALALLLQRPWFRRAWIVQEASVTKDLVIICGADKLSWDEFFLGVQYAVDLGVFIAYGGSTTYQALRLFDTRSNFQKCNLPPLHQVLLSNRSFLATDARDKVFGLLSLADQEDVKAMGATPDYRLSMEELYTNITLSLLKKPDLRAFSATGVHDKSTESSLPSWVSDWSISDPSVPLASTDSLAHQDNSYEALRPIAFNASRSTVSAPAFDHPKKLLRLEGILVDQIETVGTLSRTRYLHHVSHMFELFVQCHDILSQLKNWESVAQMRTFGRYRTGEKSRDAYWHTLCAGRVPENLQSAASDPRFKYYILIRSLRSVVRATVRWFPRSEKDTWYNRLFYSMFQAAWRAFGLTPAKIQRIGFPPESHLSNYRRMVRTKTGYIALAPRFAQADDWIGVFRGGKLPLVVRKDGDHYVLIGESYVHGIMKGEAWEEAKCEWMWFK